MESADRVELEPLTAAHAGELFAALTDPAIYTYPRGSVENTDDVYRLAKFRSLDGE